MLVFDNAPIPAVAESHLILFCAYTQTGDYIIVLEENANGTWKGSCNNAVGYFPNTAIALVNFC